MASKKSKIDSKNVKIGFQKCLKAGGSTPKYWNSFGIIIIGVVIIITLKWKLSLDRYFCTEGRIISFIDVGSVWIDRTQPPLSWDFGYKFPPW